MKKHTALHQRPVSGTTGRPIPRRHPSVDHKIQNAALIPFINNIPPPRGGKIDQRTTSTARTMIWGGGAKTLTNQSNPLKLHEKF